MKFGNLRKSLLIFCLSTSIVLHTGAIWFLNAHPFKLSESPSLSVIKPAPEPLFVPKDDEAILTQRREEALEESLNKVISINPSELHQGLASVGKETADSALASKAQFYSRPRFREEDFFVMEVENQDCVAAMPPPFDPELEQSLSDFALEDELDEELFFYESEGVASVDLSDHRLVKDPQKVAEFFEDDYTMTDTQFSPSKCPRESEVSLSPRFISSLKNLDTSKKESPEEMSEEQMFSALPESTSPQLILPNSVDYLRNQWVKRSLAERSLPEIAHYGLEVIKSNIEWEEDIEVQVTMMPDPSGDKYIFSLDIEPEFESECETMKQNFYFLLDRSSSIDKAKFNRFKRAALRSMAALCDTDHFNIYIFDKKIEQLSNQTLPVTPKTIQMAENFLEKQHGKTHFAAGEVYVSLDKMLPERFNPDEMHSVILITDGNTLLRPAKQKKIIAYWGERFDGNVNFYTVASGKGNNLVLLDMLSYTTGGKLLYSDTNAALPRKLVRLIRDLHSPIVKNVTIDVSGLDSNAKVSLFPRKQLLPPMYSRQTYHVVGTVDELCDLNLYIQGRNHDRWINIKKKISLKDAHRGGRNLEKLWANTQSKICYDHFLQNGRTTHLKEAKQIVAPYRGTIAMDE